MTNKDKYDVIIGFVRYLKPSFRLDYCNRSQLYHEKLGDFTSKSNSINKNWLTGYYGSIPESKIDRQYDFTIEYRKELIEKGIIPKDTVQGDSTKQEEPGGMGRIHQKLQAQ